MKPEEILKKHHDKYKNHVQKKYYKADILKAMDEYSNQQVENAINETFRLKFNNSTKISNFVYFGSKKTDWLSNDEIKSEVLKKLQSNIN